MSATNSRRHFIQYSRCLGLDLERACIRPIAHSNCGRVSGSASSLFKSQKSWSFRSVVRTSPEAFAMDGPSTRDNLPDKDLDCGLVLAAERFGAGCWSVDCELTGGSLSAGAIAAFRGGNFSKTRVVTDDLLGRPLRTIQ